MKSLKESISVSVSATTTTATTSNKPLTDTKKTVEINNKKNTGDLLRGMTGATPGQPYHYKPGQLGALRCKHGIR